MPYLELSMEEIIEKFGDVYLNIDRVRFSEVYYSKIEGNITIYGVLSSDCGELDSIEGIKDNKWISLDVFENE